MLQRAHLNMILAIPSTSVCSAPSDLYTLTPSTCKEQREGLREGIWRGNKLRDNSETSTIAVAMIFACDKEPPSFKDAATVAITWSPAP